MNSVVADLKDVSWEGERYGSDEINGNIGRGGIVRYRHAGWAGGEDVFREVEKMNVKGIILTTAQVQELQRDGRVTVYKAVKPEPRNGIRKSVFAKSDFEDLHGYEVKPPYQIGQAVYVRETWQNAPHDVTVDYSHGDVLAILDHTGEFAYKESPPPFINMKWFSPATMPREAARLFGIVEEVNAEQQNGKWFWKIDIVKGEKPEDF